MNIFGRIRSFFGGIVERVSDELSDFVGLFRGERARSAEDYDDTDDYVSDEAPTAQDDEDAAPVPAVSSGDEVILPDDDDADDVSDDGLIWNFDASLMGDLSEGGDGKQFIEADYTIVLNDGEQIEGSIRFYGEEERLVKAIIAKHGEIKSGDIAHIIVHDLDIA